MRAIFSNPAEEKNINRFIWMVENKILKKNIFLAKICLMETLFPPLVNVKKQHQNFERKKMMRQKTFRCSKIL